MCRGRHYTNDPPEEPSPDDKKVDDFFGGVHRFSDSLSEKTKRFLAKRREFESRWKNGFNYNSEIDQYMNKPYQTRSTEEFPTPFSLFEKESIAEFLPKLGANLFDMFDESSGATPFGLHAYQTPTPRAYDTCMEKKGVSLWDSAGYWRCLFPNSAVPVEDLDFKRKYLSQRILTKEDFEENVKGQNSAGEIDLGPKGVFFKHYNDYLNWRRDRLRKQRSSFAEDNLQPQTVVQKQDELSVEGAVAPTVVGTEIKSFMNSSDEEITQREVKTEYYSDGTSKTSNIIRTKPLGSDTWETTKELSGEEGKSGWFWN